MTDAEAASPTSDWIVDADGNRASIEWFGSKEAAQRALDSLMGCRNTTNCSGCSGCSGCSRCSRCSDCSGCSGCSRCSGCSGCSHVALVSERKDVDALGTGVTGPPPVPVIDDIDAKVYAAVSQPGALNMSTWHTCETTHCRAGWVVHLAGEAGYALERFHGGLTGHAAKLIYAASGSPINPCRFYDDDATALADMKARAEAA